VYNFKEIAHQLQLSLHTSSDSEVILEAFSKQGADFVHALNGMFALAIYDKDQQKLYLFRDRLGIKPLFYFWDGVKFAFASELKSLLTLSGIPRQLNHQAISHFLRLGYIPAPGTIYNNIYKVLPGNYIKLSKNKLEEHCYWKLQSKILPETIQNEQEAFNGLNQLLESAVRYQLISDVPLGIFLSGGIDSSLVAAIAASQSEKPVNTFSIGFEDSRFDESRYAQVVAKHLNTTHHPFIVSASQTKDLVESMLDLYDEPYADSSAIPTMLISQLARQHVKVVLCGDGADELFFGYGMHVWAKRLQYKGVHLFKKPLRKLLQQGAHARYQKAADMLDYADEKYLQEHIFSQDQGFFSDRDLQHLLIKNQFYANGQSAGNNITFSSGLLTNKGRKISPMEKQALFDTQYYLPDDLLVKVDRASMKYGLEARVPYLDHQVVEFAINLSPDLKYKNGTSKYILKQVLFDRLPAHLFNRPKQGFSIPLHEWLRKDLKYLLDDYLNEQVIRQVGIVEYGQVKQLKERFLDGNNYPYNRLWILIVLHRFLVKKKFHL
jgi:asparagine synthase (glutamine-hydrolysing)